MIRVVMAKDWSQIARVDDVIIFGDYPVIVDIQNENFVILILEIGYRRDIYK